MIYLLLTTIGPIAEINLPVDSVSKNIKGFATITFMMPEHAVKAYGELDGSVLHGRMLHLLPGKDKEVSKHENLEGRKIYIIISFGTNRRRMFLTFFCFIGTLLIVSAEEV